MAGEDLTLRAVIETALDAEGFEQFKSRLGEISSAAGTASEKTGGFARGADELGKKLPRIGVRLLTAELLQNAGALGVGGRAAGELARAASLLTLGLGPLGVTIGALSVGAALVASRMQQKREAMDRAAAAAEKLRENDSKLIDQLERLKAATGNLPPILARLLAAKKAVNDEALRGLNIAMIETLFTTREEIRALEASSERLRGNLAIRGVSKEIVEATNAKLAENANALQRARQSEAALMAQIDATRAARAAGFADLDHEIDALKAEAAARDRGFKSVEKEKEAKEKLRKAGGQVAADAEAEFKRQQQMERAREKMLADRKRDQDKLAKDAAANAADDFALSVEVERGKRAESIQTFQTAAGLLAAAFPKNKGAAIAAALIDTYAGASKALAQGGFAGIALAAAVIAFGLAQVQNIRKQEAGFDDPMNDALARYFGRKWAEDLLSNINMGVHAELGQMAGGGGVTYNQQRSTTTIYRGGVHTGSLSVSGLFGAGKTNLMKQLNRELIKIQRLENRTKLG